MNNLSSSNVRIGLQIRTDRLEFKLSGQHSLIESGSISTVAEGVYTALITETGDSPRWGVRLFASPNRLDCVDFLDKAIDLSLECEIVEMGYPVSWGDSNLNSTVFVVIYGDWANPEIAQLESRKQLNPIALKLGIATYPDELLTLEPVRMKSPTGGKIVLQGLDDSLELPSPVKIIAANNNSLFELPEMRIGIDFHWDHNEALLFRGDIELHADGDKLTLVNEIDIEEYLASLLGSEMRYDWPLQSLAAQAVAARSTILATRGRHHYGEAFDLCHDDHCQCYQGKNRESDLARRALKECQSALLIHQVSANDIRVADARYAKTCGGLSDDYATAWEDWKIPYMVPVACTSNKEHSPEPISLDWKTESEFEKAISEAPAFAACNPDIYPYPESVKEMEELFRWERRLSAEELSSLVSKRTGLSLGYISSLEALERGSSGRIISLRISGENESVIVRKELRIRRLLSESHLPSSAFIFEFSSEGDLILRGLGWGHGVGLCQLGAVALANDGWDWQSILFHYYPETKLVYRSDQEGKQS